MNIINHPPESLSEAIHASDYQDGTLLYGFDHNNTEWHVYKESGFINTLICKLGKLISFTSKTSYTNHSELIPSECMYVDRYNRQFVNDLLVTHPEPPALLTAQQTMIERKPLHLSDITIE